MAEMKFVPNLRAFRRPRLAKYFVFDIATGGRTEERYARPLRFLFLFLDDPFRRGFADMSKREGRLGIYDDFFLRDHLVAYKASRAACVLHGISRFLENLEKSENFDKI